VAASVAIAAGLVWWFWSRRFGGPSGGWGWRLVWWVVVVALSAAATLGILIGSATWLGVALADRTEPLDVSLWEPAGVTLTYYDVGVLVLAIVLLLLFARWIGCASEAARWLSYFSRRRRRLLLAGGLVLVVFGFLTFARDVANEVDPKDRERARALGAGRYDRLIVIDPADPASQRLIRLAGELVAERQEPALVQASARTAGYDVAYGLAVVQRPRGDRPLWRLVEPPTGDAYELAASLARIHPRRAPLASGSYARLLTDIVDDNLVRWRTGAQRGVLLVLDELPSLRELDRGLRRAPVIGREDEPSEACGRFIDRLDAPPAVPASASIRVPWGTGLAHQCLRARTARVALDVLSGEEGRARLAVWGSWARALGGRLSSWGSLEPDGQWLIDEARDQLTGQPVGHMRAVVDAYRPHLRFDEEEKFFPIDVDWLLTPEFRQSAGPVPCVLQEVVFGQIQCVPEVPEDEMNHVCDRETGRDNCREIANAASLVGDLDEFIDFAGGGRLGRDRIAKNRGPSRMYVHVREHPHDFEPEHEGRLYLGYWWFIPFNSSPWRPEVNCLPGLAIKDATCFDHEGDWEGVTVVLDPVDDSVQPDPYRLSNLKPVKVLYEAHGTSIHWAWPVVQRAADRDGLYASHPVVYAAAGSHASYPARCLDPECDQQLSRLGARGEGGFDGKQPWTYNERCSDFQFGRTGENLGPCLIALPSTTDGSRGVLWNAFPGRWGKATCSIIAKFCSALDGPASPSRQKRFDRPWATGKLGNERTLMRERGDHGGKAGSTPEDEWPPPGERIPDSLILPR
jgi:hypothetical protein